MPQGTRERVRKTRTSDRSRLVSELSHADGCPADPERSEVSEDRLVTPLGGLPADTRVLVVRCQDCAAHMIVPATGKELDSGEESDG